MSNKEKCPKCKSYQICTERRPNGKKWCTECDHVLESGSPLGQPFGKIVSDSVSIALEKMYDPNYDTPTFRGLSLSEKLSSRALMAVIQELSKMRDYEDELRGENV